MSEEAIQNGARQAVVNCVHLQADEHVTIITDRETEYLADALIEQVEQIPAQANKFIMEDCGIRSDDGDSPLPFAPVIGEALAQSQASFYIAQCKRGELSSFRQPMIHLIEKHGLRHGHMPGFTEIMMSQGMAADYGKIQDLCRKVYDIVAPAREIRVTTAAGTDLLAQFDPAIKWIISDGQITPDQWKNLPDGEDFTAPATADGRVVIDGCLGDFFCDKYGLMDKKPLTYNLKDGFCQADSVHCDHAALKDDFLKYTFETDENSMRLGEFAIGTNIGLTELIGNLLQDEKYPGIHLALGSPYPTKTGADWNSQAHCDGILRNPTIIVDGQTIMEQGRFLI
ncbi:aminopeptidase [Planctomycetota bacterium]